MEISSCRQCNCDDDEVMPYPECVLTGTIRLLPKQYAASVRQLLWEHEINLTFGQPRMEKSC